MTKYLCEVSYTAQAAKSLLEGGGGKRRAAAAQAAKSVGGKIESFPLRPDGGGRGKADRDAMGDTLCCQGRSFRSCRTPRDVRSLSVGALYIVPSESAGRGAA
jgi:hypothetical protein